MDVTGTQMSAAAGVMASTLQLQGLGGQIIGQTLQAMEQMQGQQQNISQGVRQTMMAASGRGQNISIIV